MIPKATINQATAQDDPQKHSGSPNGSHNECYIPNLNRNQNRSRKEEALADFSASERSAFEARFWSKVDRSRGAAGCWLWTGAPGDAYGHGAITITVATGQYYPIYAHRAAWFLEHGSFPPAPLKICHRCDVAACVNPAHLFVGAQKVNLEDARRKGRLNPGAHLIKVSDAGLADIRARYLPRVNGKKLAAEYGISLVHVMRIINGTARVKPSAKWPFQSVHFRQIPIRGEVA